jgi:hypothetical protein
MLLPLIDTKLAIFLASLFPQLLFYPLKVKIAFLTTTMICCFGKAGKKSPRPIIVQRHNKAQVGSGKFCHTSNTEMLGFG